MPCALTPVDQLKTCLYVFRRIGFCYVKNIAIHIFLVFTSCFYGAEYSSGSAVSPMAYMFPCVRFVWSRFIGTSTQHSVWVRGWLLPSRDFHPARNAKLCLAHQGPSVADVSPERQRRENVPERRLHILARRPMSISDEAVML